jgi:histidinol-phosphate phosphatase family protein
VTEQGRFSSRPTLVFLDRDGTIIRDVHYLSRPDDVELLDGTAEAIAQLNRLHVPVVIVTNQSGIGRGYFTKHDYEHVERRLNKLLATRGAHIDASYYCPHAPDDDCLCRKPQDTLFRQAIRDHRFNATFPVLIGDRWRDIAAAPALNGTGILVPSSNTPTEDLSRAKEDALVYPSLLSAVQALLTQHSKETDWPLPPSPPIR